MRDQKFVYQKDTRRDVQGVVAKDHDAHICFHAEQGFITGILG